jgi:hypothetical protein
MGILSLSDYDIGGRRLVGSRRISAPASPASAPSFRQLRRNGVKSTIRLTCALGNHIRRAPLIRIKRHQGGQQRVALLRRSRPALHTLGQLGMPLAQPRSFGRAQGLSQHGIIVGQFGLGWRRSLGALRFLVARLPTAPLPIARVGSWRPGWRRVPQQAVPVERQVRVRVLQGLTHFRVERLSTDLDVCG